MIFKGRKFRKVNAVVALPTHDKSGKLMPYVEAGKENYVYFGRTHKPITPFPQNKEWFKTTYKWNGGNFEGEAVYATPIENNGWSLTNMMYGADGRIYLMIDGAIYTSVL
jgi:hypothetical protein